MRQIIDISDRIFKTSHMKTPKGYGTWGFIVMDGSCNHEHATFFVPSPTTFSDAKVWAKAHVRDKFAEELATGHLYLEVAP